jgi:two-component system KDP operon response regulator KdpE
MEDKSILVIDDDPHLLRLLEFILSQAGWQVYTASSGQEGLEQFYVLQPNLVILDIMIPDIDGWNVCGQIRQSSQVPIMMLTALGQEEHIIRGLRESGADDYLIKPFSVNILVARIEALLRRVTLPARTKKRTAYDDGYLAISLTERRVLVKGQPVKLTTTEYRLLVYMLQYANRVLTFNHILEHVWGAAYQDSVDYVHVYMSRLRQKLEENPKNPSYLVTVHGIGYRLQLLAPFPLKQSDFSNEAAKATL